MDWTKKVGRKQVGRKLGARTRGHSLRCQENALHAGKREVDASRYPVIQFTSIPNIKNHTLKIIAHTSYKDYLKNDEEVTPSPPNILNLETAPS